MKKIGVLGGTFDPIHYGHLFVAENARHTFGLDEILIIPAARPPHKLDSVTANAEHRLNMVRLAAEGNGGFCVCDAELRRGEVSYTVDTMTELCTLHPDDELYCIIGEDSLIQLPTWKRFSELAKLVKFISVNRFERGAEAINEAVQRLSELYGAEIYTVTLPLVEFSSSDIRRRVKDGLPIKYMLPEAVERYIAENRLYTD